MKSERQEVEFLRVWNDEDGMVRCSFHGDEVIARYACDKARSVMDREFAAREIKAQMDKALNGISTASPSDLDRLRRNHG